MTVFDMHVVMNQRLQEVASYKRDKIYPEEIDVALNQAMERFIKRNMDINFEDRQSKLSNIRGIVEKNRSISTVIRSTTDADYEPFMTSIELPADYMYLANHRAEVLTSVIEPCSTAPVLGTSTLTKYITTLPFPTTALSVPPYYTALSINRNGVNIYFSYNTVVGGKTTPSGIANFNSKRAKDFIISSILETLNRRENGYQVFWEYYMGVRYSNSFIIVDSVNPVSYTAITYQSDATTIDVSTSGTISSSSYAVYNRSLLTPAYLIGKKIDIVPCYLMEGDTSYSRLKLNSFTKTKPNNPCSAEAEDLLYFYFDESFIITKAVIDYVRKPRQISLALSQSCELDPSTHREIVDLAVEILKLDIKDPSYEQVVQNTEIRTQN